MDEETVYEDDLTKYLWLEAEPDDSFDSSLGEALRYDNKTRLGGYIVVEFPDGRVHMQAQSESTAELNIEWDIIKDELTTDGPEPDVGDWVIDTAKVYVASQEGSNHTFGDGSWEATLNGIREMMDRDNFHPDVWVVSDHGNYNKIDMSEEP